MESSRTIVESLKKKIEQFASSTSQAKVGSVMEVGDGIARVSGLEHVPALEVVEFSTRSGSVVQVLASTLEGTNVEAIILSDTQLIAEGDGVTTSVHLLEVPVGEELIGSVVNPLGEPIDGKGPIGSKASSHIEMVAPGVIR